MATVETIDKITISSMYCAARSGILYIGIGSHGRWQSFPISFYGEVSLLPSRLLATS